MWGCCGDRRYLAENGDALAIVLLRYTEPLAISRRPGNWYRVGCSPHCRARNWEQGDSKHANLLGLEFLSSWYQSVLGKVAAYAGNHMAVDVLRNRSKFGASIGYMPAVENVTEPYQYRE